MSNERHDLPTLEAAPLNLSLGQHEELQVIAYLMRMVAIDCKPEAAQRLETLAYFFENETVEAQRCYKFARQRALDPKRIHQVRKGIVVVNDGEVQAVGDLTRRRK